MKNPFKTFALFLISLFIFAACEKEGSENKTKISSYNKNESHKSGQNCMECHRSGGSGEGWFIVAGSVYNASKNDIHPNATVKLYSGPNGTGTLVKTIEVDGKGNFYTTENIDFGTGLYTTVTSSDGNTKTMNSSILTGECNSCHGSSTDKIWVE